MVSAFSWNSSVSSAVSGMRASQIRGLLDFIKLVKYQPSNLALNIVKTNGFQRQAKNISQKHLLMCAAEHPLRRF